jgi:hypothetical protein
MRPLEVTLLVVLGFEILRMILGRPFLLKSIPVVPALAVALSVLQISVEGYRWQMVPAYVLAILFFTTGMRRSSVTQKHGWRRWVPVGLALLALVLAVGLPALLPVPQLDDPGGAFSVGTATLHLVDESRQDPYAPEPGQARELMLQIWYPAEPGTGEGQAPWMESADLVAPAIADWLSLPPFFLDHLTLAVSSAELNAALPTGTDRYPVILFSHGYGGFRAQNSNQAIELASHGYIVAAVEHTYGAVVTVFPDGRVAYHNPDTLPEGLSDADNLRAARLLGDQWAEDLRFALDRLEQLDRGTQVSRFAGRLDLERVAAMGHSTGGGAAIEFCHRDARCTAVLGMDPYMKPVAESTLEDGLAKPGLYLFSESWASGRDLDAFDRFYAASSGMAWRGSIAGTAHYDFSDLPLLSPLAPAIGLKGPIPGSTVVEIINTLSLAFFDQTLLARPSGILQGEGNPFTELQLERNFQ